MRFATFAIRFVAALIGASAAASATEAPARWTSEWPNTDFSKSSVDFAQIFSGGPPKDGIPALDDPEMKPVRDATELDPREGVVVLELEGAAPRAYPLRYLTWHEIVNDEVAGAPVAVTFCPLCNSAVTFDRRLGGRVLDFGVSGKLRFSDMVMFDRQTESWWQQFVGEAIVGELTGETLATVPSWLENWGAFRERNPDGLVMAEPANHRRDYGRNPYAGYDRADWPFLYRGDAPPHGVPPLARVVAVGDRAWTLNRIAKAGIVEEAGLRITWRAGQASALDAGAVAEGRDVGTIRVFDAATGAPVAHDVAFAFAFHAFHPDGVWMLE